MKMHADEVLTTGPLVRQLLRAQFPQWVDLPIEPVPSAGTDNALYRLGDDMVVRLPRIHWAIDQIEKERHWLPKLAPQLPLEIPEQLEIGPPAEGYPWEWAVYRWIKGQNVTLEQIDDPCQAAVEIAQFLKALQKIDTTRGPPALENKLRGIPLKYRDTTTRKAIAEMEGMIDTNAALAIWESALEVPEWDQDPVWFHGDLLTGNLIFDQGQLRAVIDFSGLGVGDPAPDLMIAWSLFAGKSREVFRTTLGVDAATWARGRGQAISQAVIFIPYYLETNPVGVNYAQQMLTAVLADEPR
jgi:aminoglycoside phosphotransferase (APT) family kinase protein